MRYGTVKSINFIRRPVKWAYCIASIHQIIGIGVALVKALVYFPKWH